MRTLALVLLAALAISAPAQPPPVWGNPDVTGDGFVKQNDLTAVKQHYTANGLPYEAKYDMNGDGVIDSVDYNYVFRNMNR